MFRSFTCALTAVAAAFVGDLAVAPAPAVAEGLSSATPLVVGETRSLHAPSLGGVRTVNIILPPHYSKNPARRYPVLYLLDGGLEQDLLHVAGVVQLGGIWGRSAEAIVVGIESEDRRRELTGKASDPEILKKYPTAGGSDAFRSFLRNEVKPTIERNYRTNGQDAIIGESLAGLFVVETFLKEPGLFGSFAAIDPSLWWDKQSLSLTAVKSVGEVQRNHPLYIAEAKEQAAEPAAMNRLILALKSAGLRWCKASRPDLTHSTIYQQLTPQAVQFLLPPATPPPADYGFALICTEGSR